MQYVALKGVPAARLFGNTETKLEKSGFLANSQINLI